MSAHAMAKHPAPAWLGDPSKLPKRPPGAAPVDLPAPAPPDAPRASAAAAQTAKVDELAASFRASRSAPPAADAATVSTDRPTDRPTEQASSHYALCWARKVPHVSLGLQAGRSHPMRKGDALSWLETETRRCPDFAFWLEGVTR